MKALSIVSASLFGLLLLSAGAVAQDGDQAHAPVAFVDDPLIKVGETIELDVKLEDRKLSLLGRGRWYRLDVEQSGPITIDVSSYEYDVMLQVRDEHNESIAYDKHSGVEWNAHVVLQVEAGKMYRVGALTRSMLPGPLTVSIREGEHGIPAGVELIEASVEFRRRVAVRAGTRGDAEQHKQLMLAAGDIAFNGRLFDLAEPVLHEAVRLAAEQDDVTSEAAARAFLGSIYRQRGHNDQAVAELERALPMARRSSNVQILHFVLDNLGDSLQRLRRVSEEMEYRQELLESARETGDTTNECIAMEKIASVQARQGLHAKAREGLRATVTRAKDLDSPELIASAYLALGNFHKDRFEFGPAADAYKAGISVAPPGDTQMSLVGGMGNVYLGEGRYTEARLAYLDVLAFSEESGNAQNAAAARMNLGIVYHHFGDHTAALSEYEILLSLLGELPDPDMLFLLQTNIGTAWYGLDRPDGQRAAWTLALELSRESGRLKNEAIARIQLGEFEQVQEHWDEALEHYDLAVMLAERADERYLRARALGNRADLDREMGQHDQSIRRAREAVDELVRLGDEASAVSILQTLAASALALGDVPLAMQTLAEADEFLDLPRSVALEIEEAAGVRSRFAPFARVEQDLIALRVERAGDDEDARVAIIAEGFKKTGRWKGRALLEGISEHRRGGRSGSIESLRRDLAEVFADKVARRRSLARAIRSAWEESEIELIQSQVDELDQRAIVLAAKLADIAPRDAALDSPQGLPAETVRAATLREGRILVDFVAGENRFYAYVLSQSGLEFVTLGDRTEIETDITAFLGDMSDPEQLGTVGEIVTRGSRLYAALLEPVLASAGESVDELLLIPSGELAKLPFEALVVEGAGATGFADVTFVLDRWAVGYGPSSPVMVALANIEPRRSPEKLLVLGDPIYPAELPASARVVLRGPPRLGELSRLLGTRDEAVSIASVVLGRTAEDQRRYKDDLERLRTERSIALTTPSIDVYLGGEASPDRLRGNLSDYSIVHCASHGYVDPDNPKMSGLALAFADNRSGYLPLADVLELRMDADLTVLSACQTAQGRDLKGEGLQSIARAFIYAGSRAVIASLWQVSDRETGATMSALYERHFADGLPLSEALREAKLSLRHGTLKLPEDDTRRDLRGGALHVDPRRAENVAAGHPYYWAPFIHVGQP